jgi:hypothetical protein
MRSISTVFPTFEFKKSMSLRTTMKVLSFSLTVFFFVSCRSIQPEAPAIEVAESYDVPKAAPSFIKIPIKINLKTYFDETDKSIDKTFKGTEDNCSGVSFTYLFKRDPIQFKGIGKKLQFEVDGKYSLWLSYCPACSDIFSEKPYCLTPRIPASCGVDEPMRKIHVGYETTIGVTPEYRLKSHTKFKEIEALSPCEITVFSYDATERLETELKTVLVDLEKTIDKEIGAVDLRPEMSKTWNLMARPSNLEGYGFLELNPLSIAMDEIRYVGDTAYFNAILKASPQIVSQKSNTKPKELPDLSTYVDRDGFDITMDVFTQYDSLSSILTRNLMGKKVEIKGKEIIFDSIQIYGASNKQLLIQLDFTGSKKGTLFLTGTPIFDANRQFISFPDLEFDVKSKSALLKGAKWFFDKKVTQLLRDQTAIDLAPYLKSLREELNKNLSMKLSEGVHLSGSVDAISIRIIQPRKDQLHIRIHSLGNLMIKLD